MKHQKKITLILGLIIVLGFVNQARAVPTTEWISTTYDRINVDRIDVTAIGNFTLEANYTSLKLYYAIWPTTTDSGSAIATKTVDYSNYNNATSGTAGEVKVTTTIVAYDGNAEEVNIFGGDKVYLRLYIYNASVSSSNLIVKTSFDTDYWPLGGRYSESTSTTEAAEDSGTSYWTYAMYAAAGAGVFVALFIFIYWFRGGIGSPRDEIHYPDGQMKWAERWKTAGTHKDPTSGKMVSHKPGQFKNIVDPGKSRAADIRTPHRYKHNADRRTK